MNPYLPEGTVLPEGHREPRSFVDNSDDPHGTFPAVDLRPSSQEHDEHMRRLEWARQDMMRMHK